MIYKRREELYSLPKCNAFYCLAIEMSCLRNELLVLQIIDGHCTIHSSGCQQKLKRMELYACNGHNGRLSDKFHYLFAFPYVPNNYSSLQPSGCNPKSIGRKFHRINMRYVALADFNAFVFILYIPEPKNKQIQINGLNIFFR